MIDSRVSVLARTQMGRHMGYSSDLMLLPRPRVGVSLYVVLSLETSVELQGSLQCQWAFESELRSSLLVHHDLVSHRMDVVVMSAAE